MFEPGERVICVDASLPANPWHRQHPLRWGAIYVVQEIDKHDPAYMRIDSSRRIWEQKRFRRLERKTSTDISVFEAMLNGKQLTQQETRK